METILPGTKVIIKERRNVDGTWSEIERYILLPDGSRRELPRVYR